MINKIVHMDNWRIRNIGEFFCLEGNVRGHPIFADGEKIKTSAIIEWNIKRNVMVTKNTIYTLGRTSEAMR